MSTLAERSEGRPRICKYLLLSKFSFLLYETLICVCVCDWMLWLCSNKPNPNQLSVNSVKPGLVNGAGAIPGAIPGAVSQPAGLGRACESCYSKSRTRTLHLISSPKLPVNYVNTYTICKGGKKPLLSFYFLTLYASVCVCSHHLISVVLLGTCEHAVQTVRLLLDLLEEVRWPEDAHETGWRTAWTQS